MAHEPRMPLADDDVVAIRFPEAPRPSISRSAWLGTEPFAGARQAFARLIDPIASEQFVADYWEKRPLVIPRHDAAYYRELLTLADVDDILGWAAIPANAI